MRLAMQQTDFILEELRTDAFEIVLERTKVRKR
jgi:hypothetical protein